MLFKKDQKLAILAGTQTLTFRRWASPQAKLGGQYNIPPYGAIEVTKISETTLQSISLAEAQAAGFANIEALHKQLADNKENKKTLFRIEFKYLSSELVNQPDRSLPDQGEIEAILKRIARMHWAPRALTLIRDHEGTRAGDLAQEVGQDTPTFKRNVRKLKQLGLTISLETGYKLSPRGQIILEALQA